MNDINVETTIQKTLMTARLFDGFWDRWVAHGLILSEILEVKNSLISLHNWETSFSELAAIHFENGKGCEENGDTDQAEQEYQVAALYYNLIHWIYPDRTKEKIDWYRKSNQAMEKADRFSSIPCLKETISIDGIACLGRVRIPENPKGCIVIINPIDSTKEELYSYEKHFIESGFLTVSFDGPGQGETFTFNGLKASKGRWEKFVHAVIELAANKFPYLPVHLFGTSSGAAWSIYGSANPQVERVASVSPPVSSGDMPNYFGERLQFIVEQEETDIIPKVNRMEEFSSIHLFHGNKDVMVRDEDMHLFYGNLPSPKKLVEYPDEGHCCNFELEDVRKRSMEWFVKGGN